MIKAPLQKDEIDPMSPSTKKSTCSNEFQESRFNKLTWMSIKIERIRQATNVSNKPSVTTTSEPFLRINVAAKYTVTYPHSNVETANDRKFTLKIQNEEHEKIYLI